MAQFYGHELHEAEPTSGVVRALEADVPGGKVSFKLRTSGGVVANLSLGLHTHIIVIGRLMTHPEQAIEGLELEVYQQHLKLIELRGGR